MKSEWWKKASVRKWTIKNQVKGIDFMRYSDDVKFITSQYKANNQNIAAYKFEQQIRNDYQKKRIK